MSNAAMSSFLFGSPIDSDGRKKMPPPSTTALDNPNITTQVDAAVVQEYHDSAYKACLIGSIDQGTSSSRFIVFFQAKILAWAQMEHKQIFPTGKDKVGWHEHDPCEIFNNVILCMQAVYEKLATLKNTENKHSKGTSSPSRFTISPKSSVDEDDNSFAIDLTQTPLAAIGITNQRETIVAWNRETGVPYYNAIVWDDTRTQNLVKELEHSSKAGINLVREQTGLPLSAYFCGTKVKWLLQNVQQLVQDLQNDQTKANVAFGTIDSWLLYQLTGTQSAYKGAVNCQGIFQTDVTNASRWLFCDIQKCQWDQDLVDTILGKECGSYISIDSCLPKIQPSSFVYATLHADAGLEMLQGVPLASVLGDQQAALFGQAAFTSGQAKNTYGTGLFLMMHTGETPVESKHGLLTTVAFQMQDEPVQYALEGSVSHSGSTVQWLRDQLNIIEKASDTQTMATSHNDGLYLVPAFAGLFAPHWRNDARGCIVGLTATHHKGHICRAALEATAYQTREVLKAIEADSGITVKTLRVDGGGTHNDVLMQFQADLLPDCPVVKPDVMETTALGAAFAAGLAVGIWHDLDEIGDLWRAKAELTCQMSEEDRNDNIHGWNKAIERSLGWIDDDDKKSDKVTEQEEKTKVKSNGYTNGNGHGNGYHHSQDTKDEGVDDVIVSKEVPQREMPRERTSESDKDALFGMEYEQSTLTMGIVSFAAVVGVAVFVGFCAGRAGRTSSPRYY